MSERLDQLKAKLAASTKRSGTPLPGYAERVEALKAAIATEEAGGQNGRTEV